MPDTHCGHPESSFVTSRGGTGYCSDCERETRRPDLAELERRVVEVRELLFTGYYDFSDEREPWTDFGEVIGIAERLLAAAAQVENAEYERDMHVAEGVREMKRADALSAQVETLREALRAVQQEDDLRANGYLSVPTRALVDDALEGERDE